MEQYVGVKDIAESLGLNQATVRGWVEKGVIPPPVKVNNKTLLWPEHEIELWLDSQRLKRVRSRRSKRRRIKR
jgi:predicted DNA-binding transcriptional regulator AlpA